MHLATGELTAKLYKQPAWRTAVRGTLHTCISASRGRTASPRKVGIFDEGIGEFECTIEQGAQREGGASLFSSATMKKLDWQGEEKAEGRG